MSKKHQPRRAKGAPAVKPQLPAEARVETPQQSASTLADATVLGAEQQVAAKHEAAVQETAAAGTAGEAATAQQATAQQAAVTEAIEHEATAPEASRHASTKQQATKHQGKPAIRKDSHQTARPDATHGPQTDIRGVLIQLTGARLLLPNATIAEVLSYAPPEPVEAAPEWLLGKIRWRGWQLPLVAFAELAGVGKEPAGLGSKVVVLKALGGNAKAPYFAILSQGFPRLVTVAQHGLVEDSDSAELPLGVHSRVIMNEDTAFVPDLGAVESLITDALAQAA